MKILKKIQSFSQPFFIIYLLAVIIGTTLLNSGYTFLSITIFGLSSIGLTIIWLICPDKNFNFVKKYLFIYLSIIFFYIFFYLSFLIEPLANFGYNDLILFSTGLIIFLLTSTIKWRKRVIRITFISLSLITTILCLYGIYRYLQSPFDRLTSIFFLPTQSFVAFPNAFAEFLLLMLPLQTLYLFHQSEVANITIKKIYFYISSVIIYSAFFLTFSRGAIVTLFILMVIFLILQFILVYNKKSYFTGKSIQRLIAVVLVSFVLLAGINAIREARYPINTLNDKLNFQADEGVSSVNERLSFYKGSWEMIKENPIIGIGSQNFIYSFPKYQEEPLAVSNHPHNAFFKLAVENGILTIVFGLMTVVFTLYYFAQNLKKVEQKYYTGMLGYTLFGVIIHNTFDYNLNFVMTFGIFAFFYGLMLTRLPEYDSKKDDIKKTNQLAPIYIYTSYIVIFVLTGFLVITTSHEANGNFAFKKGRELLVNNIPKTIPTDKNELIKSNLKEADKYLEQAIDQRWFNRDFQIMRANISRYLYEHNLVSKEDLHEWVEEARKATELHPENPSSWNAYGIALLANDDVKNASDAFESALSLDSFNYLEFHYYQLLIAENYTELASEKYEFVHKYKSLLFNNAHLTVITDNPKFGAKIYEVLLDSGPVEGVPSMELLQIEYDEYVEIWNAEKEKMTSIYGVDFGD